MRLSVISILMMGGIAIPAGAVAETTVFGEVIPYHVLAALPPGVLPDDVAKWPDGCWLYLDKSDDYQQVTGPDGKQYCDPIRLTAADQPFPPEVRETVPGDVPDADVLVTDDGCYFYRKDGVVHHIVTKWMTGVRLTGNETFCVG